MANAIPQKVLFNVQFTRSQLELLEKMLEQEILALESGYAHPHPTILKRTFDAVYEHLKPTPEEKKQHFENWVKQICGDATAARQRGRCVPTEMPRSAS